MSTPKGQRDDKEQGGRHGPGRPRRVPVADQRRQILDAARAIFAAQGKAEATIEEIARTGSASRQQVYELFGSKDELFNAVVAECEAIFVDAWLPVLREHMNLGLRELLRSCYELDFELLSHQPEAIEILAEAERTGNPATTRIFTRLADELRETVATRWASTDYAPVNTDHALNTVYRAMGAALVRAQWPADEPDREILIDFLTEFSLGGLIWITNRKPEIIERLG